MGKTVLIIGATGMVGSQVLRLVVDRSDVEAVISIARSEPSVRHAKLNNIVHADFNDFTALQPQLADVDVCIYCVGVYQGQVPKDRFFEITCDYQKALSDVLAAASANATFVLFSAQGADPTQKSRATFARAKGKAENLLDQTPFPKKYIFRPGYIHPTGARRPNGILYRILSVVGGPLLRWFPNAGITDRQLAEAMVSTGLDGDHPSRVFENREIRRLADLD